MTHEEKKIMNILETQCEGEIHMTRKTAIYCSTEKGRPLKGRSKMKENTEETIGQAGLHAGRQ